MKPFAQPHHDDSLSEIDENKRQGVPLKAKRWTLGDSRNIVAGTNKEPLSTTIGWIAIPSLVFGLVILWMVGGG